MGGTKKKETRRRVENHPVTAKRMVRPLYRPPGNLPRVGCPRFASDHLLPTQGCSPSKDDKPAARSEEALSTDHAKAMDETDAKRKESQEALKAAEALSNTPGPRGNIQHSRLFSSTGS